MMNITSKCLCWPKILKFDCMLTIVDFLPNTIDFQSSESLIEKIYDGRLETWHEPCWGPMINNGNHLRHLQHEFPWETQNPSCGLLAYAEVSLVNPWVSWEPLKACLEKNGRENFGVQQLALFNLLKPEYLDWHIHHSWLEGRRWLNT